MTYDSMGRLGAALGQSDVSREKNGKVSEAGLKSLEICQEAGVDIGFGTDPIVVDGDPLADIA